MLIELSGSPSSGKDEIIRSIRESGDYTPLDVVRSNSRKSPFKNSYFELRVFWTNFNRCWSIMNTLEREDIQSSRYIIFNRGLFDSIAYARLVSEDNAAYRGIAQDVEKWIMQSKLLDRLDIIFLLLTPYEKAKERKKMFKSRPTSSFRLVNEEVMKTLNEIYLNLYYELRLQYRIEMIDDREEFMSLEKKTSRICSKISRLRPSNNRTCPLKTGGILSFLLRRMNSLRK